MCILIEYIISYGIILHVYHYIRRSFLTDPKTRIDRETERTQDNEMLGRRAGGGGGGEERVEENGAGIQTEGVKVKGGLEKEGMYKRY